MTLRQNKAGYFVISGLNSFATSFYFYYLFFFMQRQFGFGNMQNLGLAALNGFIYMFAAWQAGRLGQRHGYAKALKFGLVVMVLALLAGAFVTTSTGQIAVMSIWTVGLCFTWPNLEALVSEGENALGLQKMIGIYNLDWAGSSALAYFSGGLLVESLGPRSIFWIPLGIHVVQLGLLGWLRVKSDAQIVLERSPVQILELPLNPRPISRARKFLRMAWLANPFAYVAINTVIAVIPGLARKFDLSPAMAGIFCSIWFFSRLGTFLVLWLWTGWHYRLRWLQGAFVLMIASFATLLLARSMLAVVAAQIAFGMTIGLIYYSSLYYSMDVGEAKAEHGGLHEAAIGVGIFAGPAIGATALHLLPQYPNSGVIAVSVALCAGLVGLVTMARRVKR